MGWEDLFACKKCKGEAESVNPMAETSDNGRRTFLMFRFIRTNQDYCTFNLPKIMKILTS